MAQGTITLRPHEFIDIEAMCTELRTQGFTADIMENRKLKLRMPVCTILIQVFGNFNLSKAKTILFRLNTDFIAKYTIKPSAALSVSDDGP